MSVRNFLQDWWLSVAVSYSENTDFHPDIDGRRSCRKIGGSSVPLRFKPFQVGLLPLRIHSLRWEPLWFRTFCFITPPEDEVWPPLHRGMSGRLRSLGRWLSDGPRSAANAAPSYADFRRVWRMLDVKKLMFRRCFSRRLLRSRPATCVILGWCAAESPCGLSILICEAAAESPFVCEMSDRGVPRIGIPWRLLLA